MALDKKKWMVLGLVAAAALLIALAYGQRAPSHGSDDHTALDGDEDVLAEVNGAPVTRYDLERTIAETLNEEAIHQLDDEGQRQALESIVASRAIAHVRETEMDDAAKEALARKVARYREKLLVRQYLDAHVPPAPVTPEMIQEYYDAHPERFAGASVRHYEMLFSTRSLAASERERLVRELRNPAEHSDWRAWAASLTAQELPVSHRRGDASASALDRRIRQALGGLQVHQVSPLVYVEGRAFLLRIVDEEQRPRRPLAEVREQIRRILGPRQLRESIHQARTSVLEHAEVVYR